MRVSAREEERGPVRKATLLCVVAAAAMALSALWAAAARADYEQASLGGAFAHFGQGGEAEQLANALSIAINTTGAGGVEQGSIYVGGMNARVLRFAPGEGEKEEGGKLTLEAPQFEEAWGWGIAEGGPKDEFVRCGPAFQGSADPVEHTYEHCTPAPGVAGGAQDEDPFRYGHFEWTAALAVDQSTGYVYVYNSTGRRERNLIEVFTAKGSGVAHFGEKANKSKSPPESIEESPERLHAAFNTERSIAVDDAGAVYLNDEDYLGIVPRQKRVMCFRPEHPDDYEHYTYCGRDSDIIAADGSKFNRLALVGGDRIVAAGQHQIREYQLGGGGMPLCTYVVPSGALTAMAANPLTGEVLYYANNPDKRLHRLGPCDEGSGDFEEAQGPIVPSPNAVEIFALAINPELAWGPLRPRGIVYAAYPGTGFGDAVGDVFVPAKLVPPMVESESVTNTTTGSTTLEARIDPRGFTTSYRFQYLSAQVYAAEKDAAEAEGKSGEELEDAAFAGAAVAPAAAGTISSGAAATAAAHVAGLLPGTEYRFRVIATSECRGAGEEACATAGAAASFSTYLAAGAVPPDGRAYELVSPAEKHGAEAFPAYPIWSSCLVECKPPGSATVAVFPMQSSPAGDAVAYMGYAFSPGEGAAVFNSYLSRRTGSGWETAFLSPSLLATSGGEDLAFDPPLVHGMILQPGSSAQLSPEAPAGYTNLYLQDTADPGAPRPLLTAAPPHRSAAAFTLEYAGYSPDFSAQFFTANDALTGAGPYVPAPPDPGISGANLYEWRAGALALVNVLPGNAGVAEGASIASASPDTHAVSDDGERIYFKDASGGLYVREIGKLTREVHDPGSFLTASPDGLHVLLSDGCLYSLATTSCTDLTEDQGGFQGIAGQSEDLSRIYFVDTAALPGAGENERHQSAQPGQPNLYLFEAGARTRFIATLLASDNGGGSGAQNLAADWVAAPGRRTAEASPGGRFLAFASVGRLTGYDNTGPCESSTQGGWNEAPCREVFLYDSATGHLTCPSCNPTGEPPRGRSNLPLIKDARAWMPQPRYLTDSGRLFFDSGDRLSPRDTNGRVEDVYEYEPAGTGSCARAGGCVSLITPGTGSVDSNFLAMDETGANVFFTSRERLVRTDGDELIDVYDAREGGGFAAEGELAPGLCQGEACQGPIPAAPATAGAGSRGYQGAGNPTSAGKGGCSKGKVKKHGRCVKKKAKQHHRKHGKHTRKKPRRNGRKHADRRANDNRRARR